MSGEPRQQIVQLRQFHLEAAFPRARAPGEDIEDQLRAVDDLGGKLLFEVALLGGREVVVENDQAGVQRLAQRRHLDDFALTDESGGFGRGPRLHQASGHDSAGAGSQLRQFVERFFSLRGTRAAPLSIHAHQDRPFGRRVEGRGDLHLRQFGKPARVGGLGRGALRRRSAEPPA